MSSNLAMTVLIVWRMMRLLVGIVSVFLMVIIAFGFACYIMFFGSTESFQTLPKAVFGAWLGALSGDLSMLQLRRWGPKHHSENRVMDFTEYSVSVLFLLIMILVLVNFIIALMNDEYAEVKQRAAMHWARMQASMLIDEVSVRDRILQSKLYVIRWFLSVLTSDSDNEEDYEDGTRHDYESTLRHRQSSFRGSFSSNNSMSFGSHHNSHSRSQDSTSSWGRTVLQRSSCCCRRSILGYLHRSQRIILSKFAHRKNLSVVKLRQSEAFVRAYDQSSLLNTDVYIACSLLVILILLSKYVLKSSYTTFSLTGLLCLLLLINIFRVFSPELQFCSKKEEDKESFKTIVSRTSNDMVSHVTRFNSDDDEEEDDSDNEENILSMNTTMVESKVAEGKKKSFSSIVMNLDVDDRNDGDDESIPLPPSKNFPYPTKLSIRNRSSTGDVELGNLKHNSE